MLLEVGDGKMWGSKAFPDTFPRVNNAAFSLRALVHKARIAAKHKSSCWWATADKAGTPGWRARFYPIGNIWKWPDIHDWQSPPAIGHCGDRKRAGRVVRRFPP